MKRQTSKVLKQSTLSDAFKRKKPVVVESTQENENENECAIGDSG